MKISWHFFANSHGKGVVDGLGGTVKRTVWRYVRAGAATATTPKAFYEVAVARNPGVRIDYITKEEIMINSQKAKLVESWNETLAVPNTQKLHSVRTMGRKHLQVADTSNSNDWTLVQIREIADSEAETNSESETEIDVNTDGPPSLGDAANSVTHLDLSIGDWVLVKYDGNRFPGEVTTIGQNNDVKVNVMHKSGPNWKWPKDADHIFYYRTDVVKKIDPPTVAEHRGQFTFPSLI